MFETIAGQPRDESLRKRLTTTVVSVLAHVVILTAVIVIPLWYFDATPPVPADVLAFVAAAPAPPPPPPPPPPAAPPQAPERRPPTTQTPVNPQAAPIEVPSRVEPEPPVEQPVGTTGTVGSVDRGIVGGVEGGVPGGVAGGVVGGLQSNAPPPPPPPPQPTAPVRIGGQIKEPALVTRVNPQYPPAAREAKLEGSVILEAAVDEHGRVQSVKVLRSGGLLDKAAIDAVKQWRYAPLMLNGQPTPFVLTVTVQFSFAK
jgi:periplasmic protein TonB